MQIQNMSLFYVKIIFMYVCLDFFEQVRYIPNILGTTFQENDVQRIYINHISWMVVDGK